jgi:phospholipase/carboxylesterase
MTRGSVSSCSRAATRAFVAHGRRDPVMNVGFAHRARELLANAGIDVEYHESDAAHHIDPEHVGPAIAWLSGTLAGPG